jgi:hypothetical protein
MQAAGPASGLHANTATVQQVYNPHSEPMFGPEQQQAAAVGNGPAGMLGGQGYNTYSSSLYAAAPSPAPVLGPYGVPAGPGMQPPPVMLPSGQSDFQPFPGALAHQQQQGAHPQYPPYPPHLSSSRVMPATVHLPHPHMPGSFRVPPASISHSASPSVGVALAVRPSGPPPAHPFLPPGHPLAQAQAPWAHVPQPSPGYSTLRPGASEFVSTSSSGGGAAAPHPSVPEYGLPSGPPSAQFAPVPGPPAVGGVMPPAPAAAAGAPAPAATRTTHHDGASRVEPASQVPAPPVLPPALASVLSSVAGSRVAAQATGQAAPLVATSGTASAGNDTQQQQVPQQAPLPQPAVIAQQQQGPSEQQAAAPAPPPPRRVALQHRIAAQAIASVVRSSSVEAGKGRPGSRPVPDPRIPYHPASPSSGAASAPSSELLGSTISPVRGSYHAPTPPPVAVTVAAAGSGHVWSGAPV